MLLTMKSPPVSSYIPKSHAQRSSSTLYFRISTTYVLPSTWQNKLHTHTKLEASHTHTHTYLFFRIAINFSHRTSLIPSSLPIHISHACYIPSRLIRQYFITPRKHNGNYLFLETLQIYEQPVTYLYSDDFTRNLRPAAFSLSLRFPSWRCVSDAVVLTYR
jgi:hypothetical protein